MPSGAGHFRIGLVGGAGLIMATEIGNCDHAGEFLLMRAREARRLDAIVRPPFAKVDSRVMSANGKTWRCRELFDARV